MFNAPQNREEAVSFLRELANKIEIGGLGFRNIQVTSNVARIITEDKRDIDSNVIVADIRVEIIKDTDYGFLVGG